LGAEALLMVVRLGVEVEVEAEADVEGTRRTLVGRGWA